MVNWISVGICAGLVAVLLQATILYPSPVTAVLFYLSALPLFITGLGWGIGATAVAGLTGGLATAIAVGIKPALLFVLGTAGPPALLTWLALRSRPANGAVAVEGEVEEQGVQWYPEGRLVLWAAVMAGALTGLVLLMAAPEGDSVRDGIEGLVRQMVGAMSVGGDLEPEQLDHLISLLAAILPLAAASVWLMATLANLTIAAKLLAAFGRSPRPWARFGTLAFPRRAAWLLPLAIAGALLPDAAGFVASVFAATLLTAFALLGLAVLHGLTEGVNARGFLLAGLYVALALLNWLLVIPLAGLALLDMVFAMRARAALNPPANSV